MPALIKEQVHKAIKEHSDVFQMFGHSTKIPESAKLPTHALVVLPAGQSVALKWEKKSHSYWLPCGNIEPGGTLLQAAERETFEETGAESAELVPPLKELGTFITKLGEICVVFGSHQPNQKGVGLRSKKSCTVELRWGGWVPIEAFFEAVTAKVSAMEH